MTEQSQELAKSVSSVMAKVERLRKADDNAFAKYRFTSVDDYKDFLRPLMAENGLSIGMRETKFKMFKVMTKDKKETDHCRFTFEIWLNHANGEQSPVEATTVCLPYAMAQTTGQARSYALKEWLKSKFLASSGDLAEDVDSQNYDIQLTKAQARDIHESLMRELQEFALEGTKDDLVNWRDRNSVLIDAMPNDWNVFLKNEFKQAQIAIQMRERGGSYDPVDWDQWLIDYENQMAACTSENDVLDVAAEHEDTINNGPSTVKAAAKRVYNEALKKVGSDEQLI